MLQLLRLSAEIADRVYEAQSRSVHQLLEGWDAEIKAHAEALKEIQRRHAEQAMAEAGDAASLEVWLQGLVAQAATGDDVVLSIPTGIRVASSIAGGPSISALNSLAAAVSHADEDAIGPAQRSAAWAVSHGFMPHPGDLGSMLDGLTIDSKWSQRFHAIGDQLGEAERANGSLTRLQAQAGHILLRALKSEGQLIEAFGADRLLRLVADPRSLTPLDRDPPSAARGRGRVPEVAIDQAMRAVRGR